MDPVYFTNTIIPDIRQAANQTNLPTINVYSALEAHPNYFPDGLHPNRSGAELIANEIYNSIS
jgi:lysophospholipase L1-like esterase